MESKSFYVKSSTGSGMASAEFSIITFELVGKYLIDVPNLKAYEQTPWYFFNRLYVPPNLRNQGYGKMVMLKAMNWFDDNEFNIVNELNPYGDLNLEQLTEFYKKFDFKLVQNVEVMYRIYR